MLHYKIAEFANVDEFLRCAHRFIVVIDIYGTTNFCSNHSFSKSMTIISMSFVGAKRFVRTVKRIQLNPQNTTYFAPKSILKN